MDNLNKQDLKSILRGSKTVVGVKQARKAVAKNAVAAVFVGADADEWAVEPLVNECRIYGTPVSDVFNMKELGRACGIDVSAAAVAVLKDEQG